MTAATRPRRPLRTVRRTLRARSADGAASKNWRRPTWRPREDPAFQAELADLLHNYAGRPTPLYFAKRL